MWKLLREISCDISCICSAVGKVFSTSSVERVWLGWVEFHYNFSFFLQNFLRAVFSYSIADFSHVCRLRICAINYGFSFSLCQ